MRQLNMKLDEQKEVLLRQHEERLEGKRLTHKQGEADRMRTQGMEKHKEEVRKLNGQKQTII